MSPEELAKAVRHVQRQLQSPASENDDIFG